MANSNNISKIPLGHLIMVETRKEILVGKLKMTDLRNRIIELDNVRDLNSNYVYSSSQILMLPEIKAIQLVNQSKNSQSPSTELNTSFSSSNSSDGRSARICESAKQCALPSPSIQKSCANLSSCQLQQIQAQVNSYIYIAQTDHLYHKALADIKTQPVVSLFVEPVHFGRHFKTSVIAVATPQSVYIFDMMALGKVFREFRVLLESEHLRKVVHQSHQLVDHFKHRHDIELAGIFDTFVAYSLIEGINETVNLVDVVQKVFSISKMFFEHECTYDTFRRPLTNHERQVIAKKSVYQLKLYDHLLHDRMLANFYHQCKNFSRTFSENEDTADLAIQMQSRSAAGQQHIQRDDKWKNLLDARIGNSPA